MIGVCSGVPLSLLFPTGHAFQHSVFPTAQSAEAGKSFLPLQAPEKPVTMGLHLRFGPSLGWSTPPGCTLLLPGTPCSSLHSPCGKAWAALVWVCAPRPLYGAADQARPSRKAGRGAGAGACRELGRANKHPPTAWGASQNGPEDLPVLSGRAKTARRHPRRARRGLRRRHIPSTVTRTSAPAEGPGGRDAISSGYEK